MNKDIFDLIQPDIVEPIVVIESDKDEDNELKSKLDLIKRQLDEKERKREDLNRKITLEIKRYIEEQVSKVKMTQEVIERIIEKETVKNIHVPVHVEPKVIQAPPQVIKETRVEVQVEKKDDKKYVEESKYLDLLVKISKLENQVKEAKRMAESPIIVGNPGGSGVIGIPPPEEKPEGYVLTVNNKRKAEWKESSGSTSSDAYTPTNVTTRTTFDADDTNLDEIADTLGSLIASLQGAGIIQ